MTIEDTLTAIEQETKDIDQAWDRDSYGALSRRLHKIEGLCRGILLRMGYDTCPNYRVIKPATTGCDICNQLVV